MLGFELSITLVLCGGGRSAPPRGEKKADVAERPAAFDHVGLLVNGPPGTAGLPFI
jgi:hypothetical protein